MRFYNCDGSCKINQEEDCEFGWWFCDILVEEETLTCTTTTMTCPYRDIENVNLIFERNDVEESIGLTNPFECNKELKFGNHEPFVKIHFPVCVHKSQMSPEGYVKKDELNPFGGSEIFCSGSERELKYLKLEDFHNTVRFKLLDMTSCNTLDGKLLVQLIDVYRFKELDLRNYQDYEIQNILELQRPSIFSRHAHIKCRYFACNSGKSLLNENPEIFLNISKLPRSAPGKLNCTSLDSLKNTKTENFRNKFFEALKLLQENLLNIKEKVKEMQMDLISIRLDFQVEDERTLRLLKESKKLTQELKESNYLNEVLLLLMGQEEKVKSNKWPFRICRNQNHCNNKQLNLII